MFKYFYCRPEESLSEHGTERPISSKHKFNRQEKLRMLALRRHLDNLAGEVLEKEHIVQTTRLVVLFEKKNLGL